VTATYSHVVAPSLAAALIGQMARKG